MKIAFKITVSLLAGAILLSSCTKFLDEKVSTSYDGSMSVSTKASLEANMLGCYSQFSQSGFLSGTFCEWLLPASGLAHWNNTSALANPLERWSCCLKFTRFAQHPEAYDSFTSFYRTIYRCNSLMYSLESSPVDEAYKKEIEGEALFLRAMSYFYLVRLYGDVTLRTEAPMTTDEAYGPRNNFWEVYCQIVKDLDKAAGQMRDYNRMVSISGGNSSGRVCNYGAVACRSLVYLTIGTLLAHPDDNFWLTDRTPDFSEIGINTPSDAFTKALTDADDVILNGPFELCPSYRQLFRWTEPEDWQLKERIWAIPRSPESSISGSGLTMWALPNHYMGTADVPNFGRCHPDRWFFQKWCGRYHGTKGTGTNNSNIYVSCPDPRMDINLIHTSYIGNNNATMTCYPADNRIYNKGATILKNYGFPFYKKYYDPTFDNSVGNADFYVMRLAEVYLIAAEACANLSSSPSDSYGERAIGYVNVILERARKSTPSGAPAAEPADWTAGDFSTRDDLINGIFWERCFEMPFEHHEYFDTHRMGARWLTENIAKPKNVFLAEPEQGDFTDAGASYDGYRTLYYGRDFSYDEDWTLVRKGLISAYPQNELVYNPYLDINTHDPLKGQNPEEVFWR